MRHGRYAVFPATAQVLDPSSITEWILIPKVSLNDIKIGKAPYSIPRCVYLALFLTSVGKVRVFRYADHIYYVEPLGKENRLDKTRLKQELRIGMSRLEQAYIDNVLYMSFYN